jgi:hypothetical protein
LIGCNTQDSLAPSEVDNQTVVSIDELNMAAEMAKVSAEMRTEVENLRSSRTNNMSGFKRNNLKSLTSGGNIINVPGDFENLQEAIDAASPGDIIQIRGSLQT